MLPACQFSQVLLFACATLITLFVLGHECNRISHFERIFLLSLEVKKKDKKVNDGMRGASSVCSEADCCGRT